MSKKLPKELMARLRIGDRPGKIGVSAEALLDAGKALGLVPNHFVNMGTSAQKHNEVIDALDQDYPGWRGWSVPETEGKSHA